MLLWMLLCIPGFNTGALAFAPGAGRPPGVPDMNHPDTKLIVTKTNSIANSGEENIVTAHVVDEFGVPVPGVIVSFANSIFGQNKVTDASGNASFSFAGFAIGQANVTASVNGVPFKFGNPAVTYFVAGPPATNVPTTNLSVIDDNAVANGTEKNIVRARITDAYGNPVVNQPVLFTIAAGTANFADPNPVQTDANGYADISLVSLTAGQVSITASVNGVNIINGSPAVATFVADVPQTSNPATALIVVVPSATANGTATTSVKAHVVDANGNPVPGASVVFTIASGTASFASSATVTTDANGDAIVTLKSTVAGQVSITATVNGNPIVNGSPAKVTFTAGSPSVGISSTGLLVVNDNALANNTATNRVRARIRDAYNNPVPGATIVFTIVSGTGTFIGTGTATTNSNGNAYIDIVSTVAGQVSITATVNGVAIINGSPAVVTFVADAPNTGNPATALSVVTDNAVANNTALNSVKAHVVDANGNPVPNATIVFTITSGTATFQSAATITTDANGDAIVTLKSTVAGQVSITATVNGTPIVNGSPAVVTFVADAPNTGNPATALIIVSDFATANGTATNSVKAHVVDANGNPVENAVIIFTVNGTADFASVPAGMTDANGDFIVLLTSTVAGTVEVTATVNGISIVNGSPAVVTFVADAPQTGNPATTLSVVTDNAVANNTALNSVKAHIVDANGNPVPNATIVFTITSGTATFASSATITTNANGDAIVTLKSTVVGQVSITATVNGIPIVNGSPAIVTFVVDVPSTGNPATALSVVDDNATADDVDLNSVKAHIVDANGNPVPNATVVFTIASGTATFATAATVTTDANGDAIITLHSPVAGQVSITATVNGNPIVNGSPAVVTFVAGAPNTGNPATALIVVIPSAPANGTAVTSVKAHIVDANGNPVPNANIIFTIASGTANFASSATVTTNANGDAIVTLNSTVIGSVDITATVNGVAIVNGSPATVQFVVDVPSVTNPATALSVVTDNAVADGAATNSVKAHIVDASGHPVPNATIVFTISKGTAGFVGSATITTDANGDAIITLNSTVAGKVEITATVNGTAIINGSPAIVTFVAGVSNPGNPATALSVVVDNASANGTATNSVKAHVVDANGNPVPNATIEFTIASGTATFVGSTTVTTDANGDAIITLTSTVGGTVGITATVNGAPIVNGSPTTVTFTTDPDVSVPDTRLIVITNDALADGVETNSVKAHVVDASGTPLAMKEVFFRIESGSATVLTVQPVLTDANGDATILLASKAAGTVTVTAKVSDKPIVNGSPAKLRFVPIDIYVPRVFTPNNDGTNDVVKPIVVGITTFHYFNIYNRWGNLVFTTKDPNVGWDGRFKGILQPVETYLWIAEGLDKDKKKITRRGMVSLVR
ncbi:Ig-like domain-containing protein [Paraflavitalea devenefica]|uniref:Ig-like domain-containing protein n=1 Tax=Paraflavitalea devenefica TaxID=2716334 RepID=UPI00293C0AC7|nr:Ig-like domain-containing protein [Paraflavitalea devenefica]